MLAAHKKTTQGMHQGWFAQSSKVCTQLSPLAENALILTRFATCGQALNCYLYR
jgi:hypothetical protein